MADLSNFCTPSEEMDDIARKMRAGERDINYQKLFKDQASVKVTTIKHEQEMDAAAISMRLQSERGMSAEAANKVAQVIHPMLRMPE